MKGVFFMDEKHAEIVEKILRELQDIKVILQENVDKDKNSEE
jgi:hypothetical protein